MTSTRLNSASKKCSRCSSWAFHLCHSSSRSTRCQEISLLRTKARVQASSPSSSKVRSNNSSRTFRCMDSSRTNLEGSPSSLSGLPSSTGRVRLHSNSSSNSSSRWQEGSAVLNSIICLLVCSLLCSTRDSHLSNSSRSTWEVLALSKAHQHSHRASHRTLAINSTVG